MKFNRTNSPHRLGNVQARPCRGDNESGNETLKSRARNIVVSAGQMFVVSADAAESPHGDPDRANRSRVYCTIKSCLYYVRVECSAAQGDRKSVV